MQSQTRYHAHRSDFSRASLLFSSGSNSSKFRVNAASVKQPSSNERWPAAPTQVLRERILFYDNLKGDDFRHPLDQSNTSTVRSIPGLELIARSFLGPAAEQVLVLENMATSVKVGPGQLPSIHKLIVEAAHILQMDPPDLYVRQNPVPNAYTLAIAGRQPFIVIHTALLELLTPRELQAVISHELGHLKCDHGLWLTVANVLASGTVSMLPFFTGMVEEALMRWLRAAELTCDRAALLVAQEPKVVVSALMKLAGGSPSFASELNVEAFLEQARSYDEATNSIIGWYLRNAQTSALSHPLPVMRAKEIDQWAQSQEYKNLLSKNFANRVVRTEFLGPAQAASYGIHSINSASEPLRFVPPSDEPSPSRQHSQQGKQVRVGGSGRPVGATAWGSSDRGQQQQGKTANEDLLGSILRHGFNLIV